jgi:hypothetical protein
VIFLQEAYTDPGDGLCIFLFDNFFFATYSVYDFCTVERKIDEKMYSRGIKKQML